MITSLDYNKLQNRTNIIKLTINPITPKVTFEQAIVIENLKVHKKLLSSICSASPIPYIYWRSGASGRQSRPLRLPLAGNDTVSRF